MHLYLIYHYLCVNICCVLIAALKWNEHKDMRLCPFFGGRDTHQITPLA